MLHSLSSHRREAASSPLTDVPNSKKAVTDRILQFTLNLLQLHLVPESRILDVDVVSKALTNASWNAVSFGCGM
jgi:hypothetical protein